MNIVNRTKYYWTFALPIMFLSACGPFSHKYSAPERNPENVRVIIQYRGESVYPQPLYFLEGKTCSQPRSLEIEPLGTKLVLVPVGESASFMLGDMTSAHSTGQGLGVGLCNVAFTFTPEKDVSYYITYSRKPSTCGVNLMEVRDGQKRDISELMMRRNYSPPFFGGTGPHCADKPR